MLLSKNTHHEQSALADYCKSGKLEPISGINLKNIFQYRRLVFNNILDTLESAYPITYQLIGDEKWVQLVNSFFSEYKVQTPQIWRMPEEFKEYVVHSQPKLIDEYFCLKNLLEFEWMEIEIFMMPDIPKEEKKEENTYLLNPETTILQFEYPVHLKNANAILKEEKGTYFTAIHRNPDSGNVQFTNLTIPFVDVIEHLAQKPLTKNDIITILKKYASTEIVETACIQFLNQSIQTQLIY